MPELQFNLEVTDGQLAEIDRVKNVLDPEMSRDNFLIICLEAGLLEAKHQADSKTPFRFDD
jgi:hypothetical protein